MPITWTHVAGRIGWYVFLLLLFLLYLRYFEWKNIYYPTRVLEATPGDFGMEYEEVPFVAEDSCALHGWWIPHPKARGTIIVCHGNAGNIGDRAWMAADLARLDVNVFLFDYRGYGQSRGIPTEKGTYKDARAAFEVVRAKYKDMDKPPVIAYGRSLGGGIAVQLAMDKPLRGIIVDSCFTSVPDMGRELYPWLPIGLISRWHYDSLAKVGDIHVAKLFVNSTQDELVPFEMGRRLFDAAAEPKEFVELRGGHNEAGWDVSPEYWRALERFVEKTLGPRLPAELSQKTEGKGEKSRDLR